MQTEVTLQLVVTIEAEDESSHEDQLNQMISDLENLGYDVLIEDEERIDDLFDHLSEEDDFPYGVTED